ncbi:MAG: glycyl radical protein [Candidatus Helarchaeota archaeon]
MSSEMVLKRTEKLKNLLLSSPYEICIERARYFTEAYKKHENEPEILKRAKAVALTLRKIKIFIREDEMLVGNETSKNLAEKICFDLYSFRDLVKKRFIKRLRRRKVQPFQISDEDAEELEQLIPFWKKKALYDNLIYYRMVNEKIIQKPIRQQAYTPNIALMTGTSEGHLCFGHEKVLKLGYKGIIKEAEEFQNKLNKNDPEFMRKFNFYESIKIIYQAGIEYSQRHSKLALEMARVEKNERRKKELELIAEITKKIPENPPETFHEAIQTIWFTQNIANIIYYRSVLALGRLDQILFPFYQKDLADNKLTRNIALELIEELNLKLTWNCRLLQEEYSMAANALGLNTQTITIGGIDKNGKDATNELSYMFLEAQKNMKAITTDLSVRIHSKTPKEFLLNALKVFQSTSGIAFYNDDVIIPALLKAEYSEEDAYNYVLIGCVEPTSQGNTMACTGAMFINLPGVLELVLNNGYSHCSRQIDGLQTGELEDLDSYDKFFDALKKQLSYNIKLAVRIANIWEEESLKFCLQPFISASIDGCMESGKDIHEGGAKYNFSSITAYGFATFVDSLYIIKKLIYEEKKLTLSEFVEILNSNFDGKEDFRQVLINKYPKWGNDHDEIDSFARELWDLYCSEVIKHETIRGGRFNPGAYSMGLHVLEGFLTIASADGRKAYQPISNSLSPVNQVEKNGPTAVLKSIAKLDYSLAINGVAVNIRFHPLSLNNEEKLEKYYDLIKTYFKLGGMQVQPNVVSTKVLRDAQKHPENYPDLLVKIGGYNALFTDLGSPIQNDIINRLENQI